VCALDRHEINLFSSSEDVYELDVKWLVHLNRLNDMQGHTLQLLVK